MLNTIPTYDNVYGAIACLATVAIMCVMFAATKFAMKVEKRGGSGWRAMVVFFGGIVSCLVVAGVAGGIFANTTGNTAPLADANRTAIANALMATYDAAPVTGIATLPDTANTTAKDIPINGPAGARTCSVSVGETADSAAIICSGGTEYPRPDQPHPQQPEATR